MTVPLTYECQVHFHLRHRGRKEIHLGQEPQRPPLESGRIPRVARLMALALRFEKLIHDGIVADYRELAELSQVTRARISQIMNLLNLAPDIQEELLFLPRTIIGRDPLHLRMLQSIAAEPKWPKQRAMWKGKKK